MTDDNEHKANDDRPGLPATVNRRVLLSWVSLGAERLWPVLWPAGGRDFRDGHVFGVQNAIAIVEVVHRILGVLRQL